VAGALGHEYGPDESVAGYRGELGRDRRRTSWRKKQLAYKRDHVLGVGSRAWAAYLRYVLQEPLPPYPYGHHERRCHAALRACLLKAPEREARLHEWITRTLAHGRPTRGIRRLRLSAAY
jgi:hypothetical protein